MNSWQRRNARRKITTRRDRLTIYLPLTIHEVVMIKPTAIETLETLDFFVSAMRQIAEEARTNPEIVKTADLYYPEEGCLSMPGWVANVPRFQTVTIKGKDRHGHDMRVKADGLLAQAFQHEGDHLDGVLFFDHLDSPDKLRRSERKPETADI